MIHIEPCTNLCRNTCYAVTILHSRCYLDVSRFIQPPTIHLADTGAQVATSRFQSQVASLIVQIICRQLRTCNNRYLHRFISRRLTLVYNTSKRFVSRNECQKPNNK